MGYRTTGGRAIKFIESYVVHGEGDKFGQPFILEDWQKSELHRLYQVTATGDRKHDRTLIGVPKGNGKTELAAAVAVYELAGQVTESPLIPVAAASYEQADLVFGACRSMIREGPLNPFFDVYEKVIKPKQGSGRMYRVAAIAGTNDGQRPTFFVADEIHEWEGRKERVHLIMSNGLAKRRGGWALNITTAGYDEETLLGTMWQHGTKVNNGEVKDPGMYMSWRQARPDAFDLTDPTQLEAAVREANPASFLPHDQVVARFYQTPENEFRRYHLNQWVAAAQRWLPTGAWKKLRDHDRAVEAGSEITLGFDGSYNGDATAVIACTLDGYLFPIGIWERPDELQDWQVPRHEVDVAVRAAFADYQVMRLEGDPTGWHREMEEWAEDFGVDRVLALPQTRARMVPACSRFYTAVLEGTISHNGDQTLSRHLSNATLKETPNGAYIVKPARMSARKIDGAVAAVIALDASSRVDAYQPTIEFV